MKNPFSLETKRILVTGASSGIGRSVAIEASKMGAIIYLSGRNIERLEETKSLLNGEGHVLFSGDLNKEAILDELTNSLPKLDGVVFCAGIMNVLPLKFIDNDLISSMIDTNLISNIKLTRELQIKKKLSRKVSLVYITSINGGVVGTKAHSLYASTKAGLTGFARSLSTDLARSGARVNSIAPGMVLTDGVENAYGSIEKGTLDKELEKYPLKRYGKPEDVAHSAIFLLSEASSWVTGTTMVVDGGYTAQ